MRVPTGFRLGDKPSSRVAAARTAPWELLWKHTTARRGGSGKLRSMFSDSERNSRAFLNRKLPGVNKYMHRRCNACHYSPTLRTPHGNSKIDTRSPQGRELDVLWILVDRSPPAKVEGKGLTPSLPRRFKSRASEPSTSPRAHHGPPQGRQRSPDGVTGP